MPAFRSWFRIALSIAFVLSAAAARADLIAPNSISDSPNAVASSGGTPVYANNLVTTQYDGLGLRFVNGTAITQLNNTPVWAPITLTPHPTISYTFWGVGMNFVSPGSLRSTTVTSLTVDTIGLTGTPDLVVDSLYGRQLNIDPVVQPGPDGSQMWTFNGSGIGSFGVSPSPSQNGAWGVAAVSVTPATAPEPSSLVLAGLGALGLVALLGGGKIIVIRPA